MSAQNESKVGWVAMASLIIMSTFLIRKGPWEATEKNGNYVAVPPAAKG